MTQRLRQYQVDAFADEAFRGNPAAVVLVDEWPPDDVLQDIAVENGYSETAYLLRALEGDEADWHLRWFTPGGEVKLCGHATLASAHVLFRHENFAGPAVRFRTLSDILTVERRGDAYVMDFPAIASEPVEDERVQQALGRRPEAVRASALDHVRRMAVLSSEAEVREARPDLGAVRDLLPGGCLLITAPGDEADFVSRFFAPYCGIDEDPVTGSAHCMLAPYWAERLGQPVLEARQLSRRSGDVSCELRGGRVLLGGRAVTFLDGWIHI